MAMNSSIRFFVTQYNPEGVSKMVNVPKDVMFKAIGFNSFVATVNWGADLEEILTVEELERKIQALQNKQNIRVDFESAVGLPHVAHVGYYTDYQIPIVERIWSRP